MKNYMVYLVYSDSQYPSIIIMDKLTKEEAMNIVNAFPDREDRMITFDKMNQPEPCMREMFQDMGKDMTGE